jgi:hypothetical protein
MPLCCCCQQKKTFNFDLFSVLAEGTQHSHPMILNVMTATMRTLIVEHEVACGGTIVWQASSADVSASDIQLANMPTYTSEV